MCEAIRNTPSSIELVAESAYIPVERLIVIQRSELSASADELFLIVRVCGAEV